MIWTRTPRRADRLGRRPGFDCLEIRCVLSALSTTPGTAAPPEYDPLIGASAVRTQYNVTGQGLTAAVIDTGVNYHDEALGGGFGPGDKVVAGYDFADNTATLSASSTHGTSVAGLLASSDPAHPGVAPGADIADLQVFDQNNQGSYQSIIAALQWVVANHDQYNITVVNVSISDNRNYSIDMFSHDGGVGQQIATLIGQLKGLNIPVVAATGNSFSGQQGQGFIAILPDTVSVTGTDLSDHFATDAQRLGTQLGGPRATDLAAPSVNLEAPQDGNSFAQVSGTSFAAPLVSGGIILLQSIYEQRFHTLPTVDQLVGWLQQGSDPIVDPVTGITIGRLDLSKAAALIPAPPTPPAPPPPMTQIFQEGVLVATVPANDASNPLQDPFSAFGLQGTIQTVSSWSALGSAMRNALGAFGLDGTYQTISTWNANGPASATPAASAHRALHLTPVRSAAPAPSFAARSMAVARLRR